MKKPETSANPNANSVRQPAAKPSAKDAAKPGITIYYNPTCPYCHMALEFFADELPGVPVERIQLNGTEGPPRQKFNGALTSCHIGSRGIPLIIVGSQCFQGFDAEIGREIKRAVAQKL